MQKFPEMPLVVFLSLRYHLFHYILYPEISLQKISMVLTSVLLPVTVCNLPNLQFFQKKISDIHNRVKIGNESSADIFVSIHLNKIPQSQYDGWQTFYKEGSEDGARLAKTIQENLNKTIQKENNRIAKTIDKIYIIKHVEIPTTIVECGFLSNPDEEKLLLEDEYQNKLAWGIYNGIIDYFYQ